jgi:hypothetical protein
MQYAIAKSMQILYKAKVVQFFMHILNARTVCIVHFVQFCKMLAYTVLFVFAMQKTRLIYVLNFAMHQAACVCMVAVQYMHQETACSKLHTFSIIQTEKHVNILQNSSIPLPDQLIIFQFPYTASALESQR